MRRIAVLSACVLAGGLLGPSTALASQEGGDHDYRWIGVEDQFAIVLPNGETFTEDEEPTAGEEEAPPIGTRLFVSEVLYETEDGRTRGGEVGRIHVECTFQAVALNVLCDIAFVLDDGSQLHGTAAIDFSTQGTTEPLQVDIAVTGGTNDFFGATGEVSRLDISPTGGENAETVALYETNLVLAHEK
ncbi:hypothetical protein [Blastococcus mobilis]|uniref:Dirigent-like protein n=1 Tax=Blastococcus mobilis TaxID=1938746 RepID=A0A238YCJ3_9ACTN|nr:hypothetical protein [Blastococcus mobilis]SNR68314.1 hypothetical protein SAMN06272737_1194 [Blastococcus mobilis]